MDELKQTAFYSSPYDICKKFSETNKQGTIVHPKSTEYFERSRYSGRFVKQIDWIRTKSITPLQLPYLSAHPSQGVKNEGPYVREHIIAKMAGSAVITRSEGVCQPNWIGWQPIRRLSSAISSPSGLSIFSGSTPERDARNRSATAMDERIVWQAREHRSNFT